MSHVPHLSRDMVEILWEVRIEALSDRRQPGNQAFSPTTGANSPTGGGWLTAPPLSLPERPGHAATNPTRQLESQSLNCGLRCPGDK